MPVNMVPDPAQMKKDSDYLLKILIIGDASVGKTSLLLRYADGKFSPSYRVTLGVDLRYRTVDFDDKHVLMQIWDTAGQERFRTFSTMFYRGSDGIIVAYDVTNEESFKNAKRWIIDARSNSPEATVMLVGTKNDDPLKKQVPTTSAREFAELMDVPHIETSAKDNTNIDELFLEMAIQVVKMKHGQVPERRRTAVELTEQEDGSGKKAKKNYLCFWK